MIYLKRVIRIPTIVGPGPWFAIRRRSRRRIVVCTVHRVDPG